MKTSGINPEEIARLIDWNRIFVGRRFRLLNRMDLEWVDACCRQSVAHDPNQVLITHDDGSEVTRELICQFNPSNHVSTTLFNCCVRLLRARETRIEEAYHQSNRICRPHRYYIADLDCMEKLLRNDIDGATSNILNPGSYTKFLLPVSEGLKYRLIIVDKFQKSISIFNPFYNRSMPPEAAWFDEIDEDMQRYTDAIMIFLRTAGIHDDAYELTWLSNFPSYLFPNYKELVQYYEPITNACDLAIYVLTAIDYISHGVPCIFFKHNIPHLRVLLAHQVLVQKFPI